VGKLSKTDVVYFFSSRREGKLELDCSKLFNQELSASDAALLCRSILCSIGARRPDSGIISVLNAIRFASGRLPAARLHQVAVDGCETGKAEHLNQCWNS